MHYVSTRNPDTRLSAAQAIVQGLSRDGGLFLPEEIPQIPLEEIKALSKLPYPERAAKIMKLYLDEFTEEELRHNLAQLESGEYGTVLRSKGLVDAADGQWLYFDYVPGEPDIRRGAPGVTGRICVIGSQLKEDKLQVLFNV